MQFRHSCGLMRLQSKSFSASTFIRDEIWQNRSVWSYTFLSSKINEVGTIGGSEWIKFSLLSLKKEKKHWEKIWNWVLPDSRISNHLIPCIFLCWDLTDSRGLCGDGDLRLSRFRGSWRLPSNGRSYGSDCHYHLKMFENSEMHRGDNIMRDDMVILLS